MVLGHGDTLTAQQVEDLTVTAESAPMKTVEPVSTAVIEEDDDDTMSYFSKLANED